MLRFFENPDLHIKLNTLKKGDELYFKAKDVAAALGYLKERNAIREHVSDTYKKKLCELGGPQLRAGANEPENTVYVTEPGLYELIFSSKLPGAVKFRKWVFEDVLPQIRKTGGYELSAANNKLMFKIENEFDLHRKVVEYLRRFYPELLLTAGLGELQDTPARRIKSWQKGYQKGQPDLIIQNCHKRFNGFCLEFKTPKGNGVLSEAQKELLERYTDNNFKTLVSGDYDDIVREIIEYCRGLRIPCPHCRRKFITKKTLRSHMAGFHKIRFLS